MRQLASLIALLSLAGCCCDLKKESYTKAPLTLTEAKKLEGEVTVTRQTRRAGGGGGCGHSPVCVILLPIIVYEALFPETWDEVVVRRDGEVVLSASYETNGSLIHAQYVRDGEIRETRFVELRKLGKKVYVDSAKLARLADGGTERQPIAISAQHDFIPEVRRLLERTKDPKERGEIIAEAARQLEQEGQTFALERLRAPDEADRARGAAVSALCPDRALAPMLAETKRTGGAWVKLSFVDCAAWDSPERQAAVLELVAALCASDTSPEAFDAATRTVREETSGIHERAVAAAQACAPGPNRGLVTLLLDAKVDAADLRALPGSAVETIAARHLHAGAAEERATMVALIARDVEAAHLLRALAAWEGPLEAELLPAIATRFVERKGLFQTGERGDSLRIFAAAAKARDPRWTLGAQAVFEAAAKREKDDERKAMFEAIRVLLGDRARLSEATRGLESPVSASLYPSLDAEVIAWALRASGCTQAELESAAKAKRPLAKCSGAAGE
ncbi:MAG: hypothetical protein ACOZQL_07280 [Myxococcota bacterium]